MKFEEIYAKAESECDYLKDCLKIYIGSSSENPSAEAVFHSLQSVINNQGTKAEIIKTGSFGYYGLEPLVSIQRIDGFSILYNNLTPETASGLVRDCLTNGDPRPETALCIPLSSDLPLFNLQNRIALRNCGKIDPENINHYILRGRGYGGFSRALTMSPLKVIEELKRSGLRGRGGAGFNTADKWKACKDAVGSEKYVICNALDSDPRSRTARLISESDPHSALEGILIAALSVGASRCIVCVNDDCDISIKRLNRALEQMRECNLLGKEILDTSFSCEIDIRAVPTSLVSGEETALLQFLEGKQAMPYIRPPYPAVNGLAGLPTLVNNIETLSHVAAIFQRGPEWYSGFGTGKSKGTKVITLSGGAVNRYTIEVELGTTIRCIVRDIGGGVHEGKNIKAIQLGGPTGAYFAADDLDVPFDYETLEKEESMVGSGTIEVLADTSCAVETCRDLMAYIHGQSCGKCVFCREGTYQMADILKDISDNKGSPRDTDLLIELGEAMKMGCICGLGRTAPNPVLSSIRLFRQEYDVHIKEKRCPVNSNN